MYYKHHLYYTPEYYIFRGIVNRCENPNCKQFPHYGGRGIKICSEWRNSPEAFIAHIGKRPTPKHQIDRIDNDGNYEPGNVRWATPKQNSNNRRVTLRMSFQGITLPLSEWADRFGLSYEIVFDRFERGLPAEKVLSPTKQEKNRQIAYDGRSMTSKEWAAHLGIQYRTFVARIRRQGIPKAFNQTFDRAEHMRKHRRTDAAVRDSTTGRFIG